MVVCHICRSDAPRSTSITLFPAGEVSEGGSVTLTCSSDAAPPVESFAWFKGTAQFFGDSRTFNTQVPLLSIMDIHCLKVKFMHTV